MKRVLVIGASGFVGRNLVTKLLSDGYKVRCVARDTAKVQDLAVAGCEIFQGDISDLASLRNASIGVEGIYISIHTFGAQQKNAGNKDFMEIELKGLANIIEACRTNKVNQVIYISFLGVSPDAKSAWIRGRWEAEQMLINSGINATVLRPGMIVGKGGQGFRAIVDNAKKNTAVVMGTGRQKFQPIAVSDLVCYLEAVLGEPEAYGKAFDVGFNEKLNMDQMIDIVADILNRPRPKKFHLPMGIFKTLAFLIEPLLKMQKGGFKGMIDSMETDLVGNDNAAIEKISPIKLLTFKEASQKAIFN
jgi:uncharacterized protein YbjT (DUF2867 family)